jgi:hypothetical protein
MLGIGRHYNLCDRTVGGRVTQRRARLRAVALRAAEPASSADAALAALAEVAGIVETGKNLRLDLPDPGLLAACGEVRWLVEFTADLMKRSRNTPYSSFGSTTSTGV